MNTFFAKARPAVKTAKAFACGAAFLLLAACAGYQGTTGGNLNADNAVVTQDPDSLPTLAWQTPGQRRVLTQQDKDFVRAQADPTRPALQSIVGGASPARPGRKLTAALLVPLTGKHADLGQAMLKSAQLALFDVGSASLELVPRDTKSTSAGAAAAATAAVAAGTDIILGPLFADDVRAVKAQTAGTAIPVIAFTTDWTLAGNNTYIMGFLPFTQVARAAQYAETQGLRRIGFFGPQTEYADIVLGTLQRLRTPVAHTARYNPAQNDLPVQVESYASRIRLETAAPLAEPEPGAEAGAGLVAMQDVPLAIDALVLPVGGESLRTLTSLLDINGIRAPHVRLLGTGLWDDESLTRNPLLFGSWFAAPDPAYRRDFEARYQETYGSAAPRLASLSYDATAMAAVLSRRGDGAAPFGPASLTHSRGFAGIDGLFRFRPDGLSERGLAVIEIQAGRLRVVDPAPTAFATPGS